MRITDIAIAGGGLAGSAAAAMLGRAGFDVVLVDPHSVYPPDLRCEKIDGPQLRMLRRTGLADAVLRAATYDGEAWVARFGRLVEKRRGDQHGILYDTLVNTIRAEIPRGVEFIRAKVRSVSTSAERQTLMLSTGEEISARLVILANGLNMALRQSLGMAREDMSPCHSITIGFDLAAIGRERFEFGSLTYYPERTADRMAYLSLFPIGSVMRANFMVYRDLRDPWLGKFDERPEEALLSSMPRLPNLTGDFAVVGPLKIRPADLYVTRDYLQPGIVLVGDAFATSCPAAGTGAGKVFTDVERLCNIHIPRWFASDGIGAEKIASFYTDPVKRACDAHSIAKAYSLRSLSIDDGWRLRMLRGSRFIARRTVGWLREIRVSAVRRTPTKFRRLSPHRADI
jgi:2-polyprenyl-6-methoxyphenol hydroxylase-like FAD-dependent oxidoreductase